MFRWHIIALLVVAVPLAGQLGPAQIFILIGPPGSGKSAQATLLSRNYKVPAISMASLLQQEIGKKSRMGKALASSIASGELVNDEAANELMKARLLRTDAGRGFILDGYPATEGQARALDEFLSEHGFPKPIVIILEAPDDILRERMKSRRRADDAPENMERRIREYREIGAFTEKWYGPENLARVDGTGAVPAVAQAIAQQIDSVRSRKGLRSRPAPGGGLKKRPPDPSPTP